MVGNTGVVAQFYTATGTATSTFAGAINATYLRLTSGTSTSAGGFSIDAGCFAVAGTCLSHSNLAGLVPIANGGTNSSSFSGNSIVTSNSGGTALVSTTSNPLYVTALNATGTTATSTISGSTTLSGFVGFNTTTPWGRVSINAVNTDGTAPRFVVGSSSATALLVTNAGKVGIGTSNPFSTFQIGNPTGASTGALGGIAQIFGADAGAGTASGFTLMLGSTNAAATNVGPTLGFMGESGQGVTPYPYSEIRGAKDIAGTYAGYLSFHTTDSASNIGQERMRIVSGGNVGIGSTSPWAKLSIVGATTPVFAVASSTVVTNAPNPMFEIDANSHVISYGKAPVLSSCGTSPSVVGNDADMIVTVGSVAATACTITFANAYASTPTCSISNQSMSVVNALTYTISTSAIVLSQTALTGDVINIMCHEPHS